MSDKKEKIVNLKNKRQQNETNALGHLLPQIFKNFTQALKPKLLTCFESLDDTLFDLAEKAESNQDQTRYFESMRLIRKSRDKIFSEFFYNIQSTFKSFKNNQYNFFTTTSEKDTLHNQVSLSLIDESELDETLAKTNLINKSEMAFHRQLFALEKRFSLLASGTKLTANQIPIGPHVLVNSFTKSIKFLDVEVNMKLIIYKLFERNVMGQLNPMYLSVNELLAESGIIPEIKYNLGRPNSGNTATNQSQNSNNSFNTSNSETQQQNHQPNTQNTPNLNNTTNNTQQNNQSIDPNYQLISQLFKQTNQSIQLNQEQNNINQANLTQRHNQSAPVANIDMTSMMNALSILQNDMFNPATNQKIQNSQNMSPSEIKDELIKQLHKIDSDTKDQVVRQKDEDTIDLVGMLFQFIVDDRNLPDAIQVILAKLQIPYLKIALQDKNLFADKNHPARKLLDSLSIASVGWSQESDKKNQFFNKLEEVVYEILEADEFDIEVFNQLQSNFNQFLKKLEKKADVLQKRTRERTLGQEKIEQAKKDSAQLFVDKISNKEMPILIRDILLGEWSNVLVLMNLRYTKNSEEYKSKVDFIEELIHYSHPSKDTIIDNAIITKLTDTYEDGLKLVAFNPKEIIDKQYLLVNCLKDIHQLNNRPLSESEIELIAPEEILKLSEIKKKDNGIVEYIEEIIEPSASDTQETTFDETKDIYLETISSMETGTWLEFINADKTTVRAKLSWISPITDKYLFVNARGLKISDRSKLELAAGLRNKSIRKLQQIALFDRALSSIADQMKDKKTN
jgi:hypothetical protein